MKKIRCNNRIISIGEFSKDNCYSPEQFLEYINSLIDDPSAVVSFKERKTIDDECGWIKSTIHLTSIQRMVMLVAQWNNKIVGSVATSILPERRDHVAELGISIMNGFRGYGLGKYLLREIIAASKKKLMPTPHQIRVSTFGSNSGGIHFYKRHGFKEVARIPNQFQDGNQFVDEIIMLYATTNNLKEV